jgi:hypothetical protein
LDVRRWGNSARCPAGPNIAISYWLQLIVKTAGRKFCSTEGLKHIGKMERVRKILQD